VRWLFVILLFPTALSWGVGKEEPPLFAGNIIAFSGTNTAPGKFNAQTFIYLTRLNGFYNNDSQLVSDLNVHQYEVEVELTFGLIKNIEFMVELYGYQIHNNGRARYSLGDFDAFLGFQVLKEKKNSCIPNIRFLIGEIFPTGRYDRLDERFSGGDGVGEGAFSTFLTFIASKTCYGKHPFNWSLNIYYIISSEVHVKERNIYIDLPSIQGNVSPGVQFQVDWAFEYKFNKFWGFGMDVFFEQQNRSSFRTHSSVSSIPDIPSSYSLSLAPSLEYNFNQKMNLLAGAWFTVAGRNDFSFRTVVFALYRAF
jgi:opacity protein-like surface antigen